MKKNIIAIFIGLFLPLGSAWATITINSVTFNGGASTTVSGGSSVVMTVTATTVWDGNEDSDEWHATEYIIGNEPPVCTTPDHHNHDAGTYTESYTISAPSSDGDYTVQVIAYNEKKCTKGFSDSFPVNNAIIVGTGIPQVAASCTDVFPSGVSNSSTKGKIKIEKNVRIDGAGASLPTTELDVDGSSRCDLSVCAESGSTSLPVSITIKRGDKSDGDYKLNKNSTDTVGNNNDYQFDKFEVEEFSSITFSTDQSVYYFDDKVEIKKNSIVNFAPGDYWFNDEFKISEGVGINIVPNGTVRIFVKKKIEIDKNASINNSPGSDPSNLLFYSQDDIKIKEGVGVSAYLYSDKKIEIDKNSVLTGGASASDELKVKQGTQINFQSAESADFGEFCEGGAADVASYFISSNSPAATCEAAQITVSPRDSDGNPISSDGTTITLTTDIANDGWSVITGGSTITNGNEYTFTGGETSVVLGLQKTTPATLNVSVSDGEASSSAISVQFLDVVLRLSDLSNNDLPNMIAGITTNAKLSAIRKNTTTGACVAALANQTDLPVEFAYECNNPVTCIISRDLEISGSPIDENNNGAVGDYQSLDLDFNANGESFFTVNYFDVGLITVHAQMDIPASGVNPALSNVSGTSQFVVKPHDLVITQVESNDATPQSNPATTSSGTGFVAAGEDFTVRVQALNFNDRITPNFGKETGTSESVELNFDTLIFPAGVNGSLAAGTFALTSTDGELEATDVRWSEVGTFTANASIFDGDYLGSGDVTGTTSGNIGRFYPDRFTLSVDSVMDSCMSGTSFSYLGAPFDVDFTVTAERTAASGGGAVLNYDSVLLFPTADLDPVAENNNDGSNLTPPLITIATSDWVNGVYTVNDANASVDKGNAAQTPLSLLSVGLKVNDTLDSREFDTLDMNAATAVDCSVATDCDARQLAGTLNMRYGRLFTQDVHGPESTSLPVPFNTQYWDGSWLLNTDDNCTAIPRTLISFSGVAADIVNPADLVAILGTSDAIFDSITATDVMFNNGDAGLLFSASGIPGNIPVDVDLSSMQWLQYDWDENGSLDTDVPTATVTFGSYRGNDRIIYWQEVLN